MTTNMKSGRRIFSLVRRLLDFVDNWIGPAAPVLAALSLPLQAWSQPCPVPAAVNDTQCTVAPGSTVNATVANGTALNATDAMGQNTANGIAVNLNNTGTTGAFAQQGASIVFNGSTLNATAGALNSASGRVGLRANGSGSSITADGVSIKMGLTSAVGANLVGVLARAGGLVSVNGAIEMFSNANGTGIVGVRAADAGSRVTMSSGSISVTSRGAVGAFADTGGTVELGNGVTVTSSGAQTSGTAPRGSHALWAAGPGALLTGTGVNASTSGTLASAARAELGGIVRLSNSMLSATGAGSAAVFAAGAAAASGGQLVLDGSTVSATQQFGYGVLVQGTGSSASLINTQIAASGNRSIALNVIGGGAATLANSTVTSASDGTTGGSAVVLDGSRSSATLTNTQVLAAPTTPTVAYGVRALSGASVTVNGGRGATQPRGV